MIEYPKTQCPKCGAWIEDMDGFGVLRHEACGYCSHASIDGGACTLCGAKIADRAALEAAIEDIRRRAAGAELDEIVDRACYEMQMPQVAEHDLRGVARKYHGVTATIIYIAPPAAPAP